MKILLLGKNGQVGRALQQVLLPLGELVALGRKEANLENLTHLHHVLEAHHADIIVNAAAYTAVDKAESDIETAHNINAKAVNVMANYARHHERLLVHYSTDYVFDGHHSKPYLETDATHPLNVYGQSKRAGEEAILGSDCKALIFRTSWVFSPHGNNFIKTVLRLAASLDKLNVVDDQQGSPTSAGLIAEVTAQAIRAYRQQKLETGIYNLTASGATSWYGLAAHIVKRARFNDAKLKLEPEQLHAIPTEAYPLPAKRPMNSRLDTGKLSSALSLQFPDWKDHVELVVDQLTGSEHSNET